MSLLIGFGEGSCMFVGGLKIKDASFRILTIRTLFFIGSSSSRCPRRVSSWVLAGTFSVLYSEIIMAMLRDCFNKRSGDLCPT